MKIAILGAGKIAKKMTETAKQLDGITIYAVGARQLDKAQKFADEFGIEKAYGSYEEMLKDDNIDLVYVATPHSHHYEHMKLCLKYNRNILCEKSFTVNEKQAKEILDIAKSKNIFVAEAIWTRYMPFLKTVNQVVDSGVIGKVTSLSVNICYSMIDVERIINPALAGGTLLDIGVYVINCAFMHFGSNPINITSCATLTDTGVDSQNSMVFTYEDGKMAFLHSSACAISDRECLINGDKGFIKIENCNNYQNLKIFDLNYEMVKQIDAPKQINGYEYQLIACKKALEEGKIECEEMPHSEILKVMETMDTLRKQWNMTLPCE